MKAEIKFIAEDYEDTQELRKVANYSGAYLALFRIREHISRMNRNCENEQVLTVTPVSLLTSELLTEIDSILNSLSINLENDVR